MKYEEFPLRSREGELIRADIRFEETGEAKPVIVFLHGFKGFKDWGPFPMVRERLANAGFITIGINFSHNGVGENLQDFTELDRFSRNTFSRELEETEDVLKIISSRSNSLPISRDDVDPDNIGLLGHSRGAAMAILSGRWSKLVRAVSAWAPVSRLDRYSERQKEAWRKKGYFDVLNQRTQQVMRIGVDLLNDIERHPDRLNILKAAAQYPHLDKPLMIITGSEDMTAPPKEAEEIARAAQGELTEFRILPQTGHTFGAEHPFKAMTRPLEEAIEITSGFFQNALVRHPIPIIR